MSLVGEPLWRKVFVGLVLVALVAVIVRMVICWPKRLTGTMGGLDAN